METDNSSRKRAKKEETDAAIGRALSRAIRESTRTEECLSHEDLSAFIDGRLDEEKRNKVLDHLSYCERCYEVFSLAHELVEEDEEVGTKDSAFKKVERKKWAYLSSAVAAAAVLIILFKFVIQPFIGYVPPSSDQIFNMLARNTDAKTLAASIKEDRITSYAFTGVMPLEKASFRIGACLTYLEVSLRAEDKTKSLNLIKRIISTLTPMEGSEDIVSFYGNMSRNIAEGISPKEFSGKSQKVESFLKDKNVFLYLRFGEWVEGGRVAAFVKDREFFDVKSSQYFVKNLEVKDLPKGIFITLNEVNTIIRKDELTEKDFKHLERAFKDIVELM